ncbi:MAG: GGDEF domain-containing protein [Candidatus Limnocylindria bacterium]
MELTWPAAALAGGLLIAGAAATVAALVNGLRHGALASVLLAGATAALVGGALAVLTGATSIALPAAASALLVLGASVAARGGALVSGQPARIAVVIAVLVLAEAAVVIELVPALADAIGPYRLALVGLALVAALASIGLGSRDLAPAGAALAVGVGALAVARGDGAEILVVLVSFIAATLLIGRSATGVERAQPAESDGQPLPDVVTYLAEGVLRFDGHLRLRTWNPAAATMLGLDGAAAGTRLEDLLGLSLPQLPAGAETVLHRTQIGGLDLSIHREATSMTVVVHESALAGNAEELGRELRSTIEELLQARRTLELQRAELERATSTDPLTGLASRAAILDRLRLEVSQARRYQHPVAILLLDIDHFSAINTAHGIEGGDTVLREVALRVRLRVRAADALGRSGSDALLSILPHTDEGGAATFADTLRQRIGKRPVRIGEAEVAVTLSVGVAVMRPGEDLDLDGLMARADEALASARSAGGDGIALDRLHGLARLERRRDPLSQRSATSDDVTDESA